MKYNTADHTIFIIQVMWIGPLGANPTKWSNTLKQFVGELFECV